MLFFYQSLSSIEGPLLSMLISLIKGLLPRRGKTDLTKGILSQKGDFFEKEETKKETCFKKKSLLIKV